MKKIGSEILLQSMNQKSFEFHKAHEFLWGYQDQIISLYRMIVSPDLPNKFGMLMNVSLYVLFFNYKLLEIRGECDCDKA